MNSVKILFFVILSFLCLATSAKVIPCTFMTREWPVVGTIHECFSMQVDFKEPNEVVDNVTLTLPNGVSIDEIKVVCIHETTCHYFPKGIEKIFKNLVALQVTYSGLKSITQENLKPFTRLRGLWLNDNNLISLEPNLFRFNPMLEIVRFDSNRLRVISIDIFDFTPKLTETHFTDNVCTSKVGKTKAQINQIVWEIIQNCQPPRENGIQDESDEIKSFKAELKQERLRIAHIKKKIHEIDEL